MTDAAEDRIARLLLTLSTTHPSFNTTGLRNHLIGLVQATEADERNRCLELVGIARRRIAQSKGRIWLAELDELEAEVQKGSQRLFAI